LNGICGATVIVPLGGTIQKETNKKELENGLSGSSQIWNSWVSVII